MLNSLLEQATQWLSVLQSQFIKVIQYPITANTRLYWLYLLTSLLLAVAVYAVMAYQQKKAETPGDYRGWRGLWSFLFPSEVWRHPSAWLDVRYFFFHQLVRLAIYGSFLLWFLTMAFGWVATEGPKYGPPASLVSMEWQALAISVVYMVVLLAVVDFVSWFMHLLQHKVSFLWEFHKVHHSAPVMHPLTNYREHPVDNLAYAIVTGAAYGAVMGLGQNLVGFVPGLPVLLGLPIIMLLYNLLGYNLRHSHIWLRWPGFLSKTFGSPAHHQVHHSYHPDHIDKNFAFMFPIWDVIFGTYCVPKTNKDVKFGISADYQPEYKSCIGIYYVPFRNIFRRVMKKVKPQRTFQEEALMKASESNTIDIV